MADITTFGTTCRTTEWSFADEPDDDNEYGVTISRTNGDYLSTYITRDEIRELAHTLLSVIGESANEVTTAVPLTDAQVRTIARDEATRVVRSYFERAIDSE